MNALPFHDLDVDASLRTILEGTATETGERFFAALVENLARALNTHGAWVTEYMEESPQDSSACFLDGRAMDSRLGDGHRGDSLRTSYQAGAAWFTIPDQSPGLSTANDHDVRAIGAA